MPTTRIAIRPDREKALTTGQEVDLLRSAYRRSPTAQMRSRLLPLLMLEEAFSEAVEILTTGDPLDYFDEITLAQAHLRDGTPAADRLAHAAAERALGLAQDDVERARALADRGKCEIRLGEQDRARETLAHALTLNPHNRDACKRIAAIMLAAGQPESFLALADSLFDQGANHAALFAAQSVSYARTGNIALARRASGFDDFHRVEPLAPPADWQTIEMFNAALVTELLTHPGTRYERNGSASNFSWRIENPTRSDTPLFNALSKQIIFAIERQVAEIVHSSGLWAAAAPQNAFLRNWCVITESDGFEGWHLHPSAWLSGVYYVRIPEAISRCTTPDGCLAFGVPEDLAGPTGAAAFGEHLVRPTDGLLMTFPSQCFHRTYPHGTREKRICVAFDLRPE